MASELLKTGPHRIAWKSVGATKVAGNTGRCRYCGAKVKVKKLGERNGLIALWAARGVRQFTAARVACWIQGMPALPASATDSSVGPCPPEF